MSQVLRNVRSAPPGGWRVIVPQTGIEVRASSCPTLVNEYANHLELNGYVVPSQLTEVVMAELCKRLPEGVCREVGATPTLTSSQIADANRMDRPRRVSPGAPSIQDVKKGFTLFWRWARAGRKLVSMGEADRRGAICVQCVNNVPHHPCPTCAVMYRAVKRLTTRRHTRYSGRLEVCRICKCCNKTQTQIPLTYLRRSPNHRYPSHCWKLETPLEEVQTPPG